MQIYISISGGPSRGSISCIISKPRELEPKKILVKVQLISLIVKVSLAKRENVVKKPRLISKKYRKRKGLLTNLNDSYKDHEFYEVLDHSLQARNQGGEIWKQTQE